MGSPGGGLALMFLVLVITLFCSISITVAASRCTWAFARDDAMPGAKLWAKVDQRLGVPVYSLALVTLVQMLLGLINIGSTSTFTAFVSVGVMALALSYALPIGLSLWTGRKQVNQAKWTMGPTVGMVVNVIALIWISFEMVLFSMPTVLPVTPASMNYASVVLAGFSAIAAFWYAVHSRKGKILLLDSIGSMLTHFQHTKARRLLKGYSDPPDVILFGALKHRMMSKKKQRIMMYTSTTIQPC